MFAELELSDALLSRYLTNNQIFAVAPSTFSGLTSLGRLYARVCFIGLGSCNYLNVLFRYLSNNQITLVTLGAFSSLTSLALL
jgi:hypothetical protein